MRETGSPAALRWILIFHVQLGSIVPLRRPWPINHLPACPAFLARSAGHSESCCARRPESATSAVVNDRPMVPHWGW